MSQRRISLLFALSLMTVSGFAQFSSLSDRPKESAVIWRDPGAVNTLNFSAGPGGESKIPKPPFSYQEEPAYGTRAKIIVTDTNRNTWEMKWGHEAQAEPFTIRLLWATGYLVEPSYFVANGQIDSVGKLGRAASRIDRSDANAFEDARLEWRDPQSVFTGKNWKWDSNPFTGSSQLAGLKIMTMLVSNWDLKDSNTSILQVSTADGGHELRYIINDWGATLGQWGDHHTRWDCSGYRADTPNFVKSVDKKGKVRFGYSGKMTAVLQDITVDHVKWLMQYLGKITDAQIRAGLEASNADPKELECFSSSVRARIEQLRKISEASSTPSRTSSSR